MYSYRGMADPDNGPTPKSSSSEEDRISTGPFSDEDIWADFDSVIELGHQLRRQDKLKEQSRDYFTKSASPAVPLLGTSGNGMSTTSSTSASEDKMISKVADNEKERICFSDTLNKSTSLKYDEKLEENGSSISRDDKRTQGDEGEEGADSGISMSQFTSCDTIQGEISLNSSQAENVRVTKEKQTPANLREAPSGIKYSQYPTMPLKHVASTSTENTKVTGQDTAKVKVTSHATGNVKATGYQGWGKNTCNPKVEDSTTDSSDSLSNHSLYFTENEKPSGFGITWFWPETEPVTMPLCNVPRMLGLGLDEWLTPTQGPYDISDSSLSELADDERNVTSSSDEEFSPRMAENQHQVANKDVRHDRVLGVESFQINSPEDVLRDALQSYGNIISKKMIEDIRPKNARNHRSHSEIPNFDGKWQNDTLILNRCAKALARRKRNTTATVQPINDAIKRERKSQGVQSENSVFAEDTPARSCEAEQNHKGKSLSQRLRKAARRVREGLQSLGKICTACCR